MNVSADISGQARYLLGLSGGPLVEALESVQPVAIVAAAFGEGRAPQLERGDLIPRYFQCSILRAAVAGQYSWASLGCNSPNAIVLVDHITIATVVGSNLDGSFGLVTSAEFNQAGTGSHTGCYVDARYQHLNLVPDPLNLTGNTNAAFPGANGLGLRRFWLSASSVTLDTRFVLTNSFSKAGNPSDVYLLVTGAIVNVALYVTFEGRIFYPGQ